MLLDKRLIRYPHSTDPRGLCTLIRKVISGLEGFGPETMCSLKPVKEMMDTQVSREKSKAKLRGKCNSPVVLVQIAAPVHPIDGEFWP